MSMDEALVSADTEPETPVAPQTHARAEALRARGVAADRGLHRRIDAAHARGVQGPADPDLDRRDRRGRPHAGPDDDVERRVQPELPDRAVRCPAVSAARRGNGRVARVERSARVPRTAAPPEGPVHPGADRGRRDLREPGLQEGRPDVGRDRDRPRRCRTAGWPSACSSPRSSATPSTSRSSRSTTTSRTARTRGASSGRCTTACSASSSCRTWRSRCSRARRDGFPKFGAVAILVFLAPLLFARQMFQRTHSLQKATNELAVKQAENEYQALHDSLTGMPNRMFFHQRLLAEIEQARSDRRPAWP